MPPQDPPTATQPPPPPPPPPPPAPQCLTRSGSDRMVGGVAGGLGRHFGLDPALVRIAFVVLVLFGGTGIALYAILWLVLPTDDGPARISSDAPASHKVALGALVVIVVVSLPFTGPGFLFAGPALLTVAVVGALGVLVWRAVGGEGSPTLTRAALMVVAVAGAALLGLAAGAAAAFGAGTVVAALVVATGVALVVGGFLGGARWLIVPAVVMAIPLAVVSAADIDLEGGVGQREYRPTSVTDLAQGYDLGVGELRVDLRDLRLPAGRTDLDLHVGVGHLQLLVPEDVCVHTKVRIGAGEVARFGRHSSGIDVRVDQRPEPRDEAPVLAVDADAGVGYVELAHHPRAFDRDWGDGSSFDEPQPACRG